MAKDEIKFAQIPFDLICRFGELSKNEIQVICCLFAHRRGSDKKCNPNRKTLSSETKICDSNLSRTIRNLEEKGWILEHENGDFTLFESYQIDKKKVIKLIRKTPKKVIKLTSKSYQIDKLLNKDLNIQRTECNTLATTIAKQPKPSAAAAEIFEEIFGMLLQIHSRQIIEAENIQNIPLWRRMLLDSKAGLTEDQLTNRNYLSRRIEFLLKDYRRENKAQPRRYVGNNTLEIGWNDPMNPLLGKAVIE